MQGADDVPRVGSDARFALRVRTGTIPRIAAREESGKHGASSCRINKPAAPVATAALAGVGRERVMSAPQKFPMPTCLISLDNVR